MDTEEWANLLEEWANHVHDGKLIVYKLEDQLSDLAVLVRKMGREIV